MHGTGGNHLSEKPTRSCQILQLNQGDFGDSSLHLVKGKTHPFSSDPTVPPAPFKDSVHQKYDTEISNSAEFQATPNLGNRLQPALLGYSPPCNCRDFKRLFSQQK